MPKAPNNGKIDVVFFTVDPASKPLDASACYWLCRNPHVGHVYVVPPFMGRPIYRNMDFLAHGKDAYHETDERDRPPQAFLGFDMKQVYAALPPDTQPASGNSKDLFEFTQKAFSAYGLRDRSDDEETTINNMHLDQGDRYTADRLKIQPLPFDMLNKCDLCVYDFKRDYMPRMQQCLPDIKQVNAIDQVLLHDSKEFLPELAKLVDGGQAPGARHAFPQCANVSTEDALRSFMQEHHLQQAVLKKHVSAQGLGIYKVVLQENGTLRVTQEKEIPYGAPSNTPPEYETVDIGKLLAKEPMLAMQWLEPEKGDVRVISAGGKIIGAYNRLPAQGKELANLAQGGHAEDYVLSAEDRLVAERTISQLQKMGYGMVALDLLADKEGQRYISEINIGNAGGLEKVHDFELQNRPRTPSAGERWAEGVVSAGRGKGLGSPD